MAKRPPPPLPPDDSSAAVGATASRTPRRRHAATETTTTERTPSQAQDDLADLWLKRIRAADKDYEAWERKFRCDRLERYYEGDQWPDLTDTEAARKYVCNLVFATVETQLPSLLFSNPTVKTEARQEHQETLDSQANERATLIQHALQHFVDDPKIQFTYETTLALRDAYSRFSLVEVGYTADWIDNPNAGKPVLKDDNEPMLDPDTQEPVLQPRRLPQKESLYVARLRPENLRVFPGRNRLTSNDWVAYGEWVDVADVKRNPNFINTERLRGDGTHRNDFGDSEPEATDHSSKDQQAKHRGQLRIWRIWDLRTKRRLVVAEGQRLLLQAWRPFEALPLAVLKFFERKDSFLPLPPIYNWLAPQDDINERREMQKIHARRAKRLFMIEHGVDAIEAGKLATLEDMGAIRVSKATPAPIVPISNAELGGDNWADLSQAREDYALVTGVSGESRGAPEGKTATQANIVNVRQSLRESRARQQVGAWLADICRLMLLALRKRQLKFNVRQELDPFTAPEDLPKTTAALTAWRQIKAEDLDEIDVDITIDLASLSPVALEAQREAYNQFVLPLLTNRESRLAIGMPRPGAPPTEVGPIFRKMATLNGITNETEIREIWRVVQALLQVDMASAAAAAAQTRDKPHATWAFKGEDMRDPLVKEAFIRAEGLQADAASTAMGPQSAPAGQSGGAAPAPAASSPGATTGTPAAAPGAGGGA